MWATYIVIITPFWWGSVPAILKGWFDRVFVAGLMWDYGKFYKTGMLKGKKAQIIVAQGEAESILHKAFLKEIQIDELLKTLTWGTFHFCGYDVLHTQKLLNAEVLTA
jgi:NAD(P)H dehydrogenase (quinone)